MKRSILFLLSICVLLFSCSDGDDPVKEVEKPPIENKDPFITLKKSNIDFTNKGGSESITIESNVTWTTKSSASWCTVSPTSGSSSTTSITLSAPANEEYDNRSCTVTIESGNISKTITVNQGENLGLLITQDRYELGNEESTIKVEVKANVEFDIEIADEWITQVETRGLTTSELAFKIAKNDTYGNREGSITIKQKGGNMSSTITIFQSQEDAIILSEKKFDLSSAAQSIDVEIKTNIDYEIIIPEDAKDWVSHSATRALRTETVVLDIAKNKDYDDRTVEVIVKDKKTDLQETVIINQSQKKKIIITKKSYDVNPFGGVLEVVIRSNTEFEVTIPDNAKWIQLDKIDSKPIVDGLSLKTVYFNVSKYDGDNSRTCEIQFSDTFEGISESITVNQSGNKDTFWGDITLSSLQDIEDFRNKEYKKIVGNLYIKSISGLTDLTLMGDYLTEVSGEIYINGDYLTNLKGLKSLSKVGYLTINKYKGPSLSGLENLTTIVYDFQLLNECRPLSSFKGLNNLASIGGSFKMIGDIYDFHELTSFKGLDNLETIGEDFILNSEFYYFKSFNGLSNLKTIGGDFKLKNAKKTGYNSFDNLINFEGLNNLLFIGGNLTLDGSFDNLESFKGLENLKVIKGNLINNYHSGDYYIFSKLESFNELQNLRELGGVVIFISRNTHGFNSLKSFEGLNHIEVINNLTLVSNNMSLVNLSSFKGLNNISEIKKSLLFYGIENNSLSLFNDFNKLQIVGDTFSLSDMPNATSLKGFENLRIVGGDLRIQNCERLSNIDALYNLRSVGTAAESSYYNRFEITNCSRLFDFCSLTNMLQNFTGTFNLSGNGYNPTLEQILNGDCRSE